jgi:hypothetical protein
MGGWREDLEKGVNLLLQLVVGRGRGRGRIPVY